MNNKVLISFLCFFLTAFISYFLTNELTSIERGFQSKLEYQTNQITPQQTYTPSNPERERRDQGVTPFLAPAIGTEGSYSCSGTIVYYDEPNATAYILGCAHCYRGKSEKPTIITYFVNGKREIREFKGKVIAINQSEDLAVLTFQPDFIPDWVPIGPADLNYFKPTQSPVGRRIIVTGRDAGLADRDRRPAAYESFIRKDNDDFYLESIQSQSRGGRSGGGVITVNRQWLIGVNHGRASTVDGIGHGLWAPLYRIHRFLKENDLDWLITVGDVPSYLPIVGIDQRHTPNRYVPRPVLPNQYVPLDGGRIMPASVTIKDEYCGCK